MKKDKKIVIGVVVLLLVLFAWGRLTGAGEEVVDDTQGVGEEKTLSPEEVLEGMEESVFLSDQASLEIISPEEDVFIPRQARMWQGELRGIEGEGGFMADCHWRFYLNENNDEVLYKEMENRSSVSKESPKVCAFTSTFIESRGELRAELEIQVKKMSNEVVGEFKAERTYRVE